MTRVQKVFLSIGLAAVLLGGSVAILPSLLWGDRADYSHVVSIKDARAYQDPALLEKAWALPVGWINWQRSPAGKWVGKSPCCAIWTSHGFASTCAL